jgi:putative secretion ATPase (PEP-CTERM system associated)
VYASFYSLTGLPFQLSPDSRFYFASENHKRAMAYLTYGLNQAEGFIVVTGDVGTGKTMLINHLLATLDPDAFVAGTLVYSQLDPTDTLRMAAAAFGLEDVGSDKAEVLRRIQRFVRDCAEHGIRPLLIIDEAQNLPTRSLEELRMLSNFQQDGREGLQTILIGQPQFRPLLASPELEQLRQRVVASFHLGPLDVSDTGAYVEHRLRIVGWNHDPRFSSEALQMIHSETGGVPRRINTLCARLLLFGFLEEIHTIDDAMVVAVAEELRGEVEQANVQTSLSAAGNGHGAGHGAANGHDPQLASTLSALSERVELLERYVHHHERTIKRGIDIATRYFGNGTMSGTTESTSFRAERYDDRH